MSESGSARLSQRFDEALQWASRLHADQVRKGTDIPYFAHLVAVTGLVLENGADEDVAIAALLHDACEDQGGMKILLEIDKRYGPRVAGIVEALSDTFEDPKPPWRERKESYVASIAGESEDALLVAAADKLHNVRTIIYDYRAVGEELWERFSCSRDDVLWYYRAMVTEMRKVWEHSLLEELDRRVSELEALVRS